MYAYLESNIVRRIYDDIAIYSDDFQKHCVEIPDGVTVEEQFTYDPETETFSAPPYVIVDDADNQIDEYKAEKIKMSKELLAKWYDDNPILYSDGLYYTVTEEKQTLLNSNLASYERATKAGIPYPLKWNSTGAECVDWSYSDLCVLSLTIAGYVAPKVSMQQAYEIRINNCTTLAEIDEVVIDYDSSSMEN